MYWENLASFESILGPGFETTSLKDDNSPALIKVVKLARWSRTCGLKRCISSIGTG